MRPLAVMNIVPSDAAIDDTTKYTQNKDKLL